MDPAARDQRQANKPWDRVLSDRVAGDGSQAGVREQAGRVRGSRHSRTWRADLCRGRGRSDRDPCVRRGGPWQQ